MSQIVNRTYRYIAQFLHWLLSDQRATELVLATLWRCQQATGYDLHICTGLGFYRIYPALHRLERQGVVASCYEWDDEQGRRRKQYFLKNSAHIEFQLQSLVKR